MSLRPFFRYYGAKWRSAPLYPAPTHTRIIEPFAGAAGYSLRYPELEVILVERYHVVAELWRWLIAATPDEVRSIPLTDNVAELPEWVPMGARYLVGFAMNAATSSPRKSISASARSLREAGRKFYGWTHEYRERVASQVNAIKHWAIIEGDYTCAPFIDATWFIDPPYQVAGRHYPEHDVDYRHLATWAQKRPMDSQVIACEHPDATWLPFREIGSIKSGPRSRSAREAVWLKEAA